MTAQLGSLALDSGELTWLNAGHPLPLLVRDGSYIGELLCRPSMPLGFGGSVAEIATVKLQPGDRVLFYTDGVTDTRVAGRRALRRSETGRFLGARNPRRRIASGDRPTPVRVDHASQRQRPERRRHAPSHRVPRLDELSRTD